MGRGWQMCCKRVCSLHGGGLVGYRLNYSVLYASRFIFVMVIMGGWIEKKAGKKLF